MQRIARPIATTVSRQTQLQAPRLPTRTYATASKQPGPTSRFYKTFTRPIAKTLVIAVFTYQFFYWGWVKLEMDEHQQKTDAEIADLEAKVSVFDKARKTGEAATKVEEGPKKKSWW